MTIEITKLLINHKEIFDPKPPKKKFLSDLIWKNILFICICLINKSKFNQFQF